MLGLQCRDTVVLSCCDRFAGAVHLYFRRRHRLQGITKQFLMTPNSISNAVVDA